MANYYNNMISQCTYYLNNERYTSGTYVYIAPELITVKKCVLYPKDAIKTHVCFDNYFFYTNDEELEQEICSQMDPDTYYIIFSYVDIDDLVSLVNRLPKNIRIRPYIEEWTNLFINSEIIDTNLQDIIGYKQNHTSSILVQSNHDMGPYNYVNIKLELFDVVTKYILKPNNTYCINKQICALYNFFSFKKNCTKTNILKLITKASSMYKQCRESDNDFISLISCKDLIKNLNIHYINSISQYRTLPRVLFEKQTEYNSIMVKGRLRSDSVDVIDSNYLNKMPIVNSVLSTRTQEDLDDIYCSFLSYDSLTDCYEDNKCICIVVKTTIINDKFKTCKCDGLGFVTNVDILRSLLIYYDKFNTFDDGTVLPGAIQGNINGNGNVGLPIYINNEHWQIAKLHAKEFMSLCTSHCSYGYSKLATPIYHLTLYAFITSIKIYTIKSLTILLNIIITCQMLIDDREFNMPTNIALTYETSDLVINIINYLILTDCKDIKSYFYNALRVKIWKNLYKFDKRKKSWFSNYAKNRNQIIKYAVQDIKSYFSVYKLCSIKSTISTVLEQFKSNNGIVTEDMLILFNNSYKLIKENDFDWILFKVDSNQNNKYNKSFVDYTILSSCVVK